ncbi:type II secretion system F family protein [Nonomuraea sp. NPDC049421]|uniref:type II secretion system F family protein n=1 Tax=Nonomuraea sp. NPDC049421 TaxID=3155275 RepID=UPI0034251011
MLHLLSALCAGMAAWLWFSPRTPADRLTRLRPPKEPPEERHPAPSRLEPVTHRLTRRTILTAACTGLLAVLLIGGTPGLITGVLLTPATAFYLHRRTPPDSQDDQRRIAADLPFAADLMTACLRAGRPVSTATETAATAIGGPLGERLTWASTRLRLGADPEPTWAYLAKDPSMGHLSRAMSRAAQTGAPVADVLTRLADDAREESRAAAVAAARSVGVKAVAPLGLCFLPAFVLLGIIPVVAGLASTIIIP